MAIKHTALRVGTSHFISLAHIIEYYRVQGEDEDAHEALNEGRVSLGEPQYNSLKEKLIVDINGRYWIEEI